MRKYNLYNDILGWFCFIVAALTYLLTLEPTASFWDCPEFISQAYKLEVGHPPGNPIFMIAGRFFVNFAGGDVTKVALMVNIMSALLSAGTILLLFWTITHFTRRLIVRDDADSVSLPKMLAIYGSGICGALMYTWSDTFWFSAVEGEVYAFSSFCTALVIWLILKWENRADKPGSDRYLVLIAYVIGVSIAVHLLNLLCIPAIALVVYYRKFRNTTAKGSLLTILVAAVIIALILFGLVPGFIGIAQYFEIFFVNTLGTSYNVGVLIYAILLLASLVWTIRSLYRQTDVGNIRWSFMCSILLSGIPFLGGSIAIGFLLLVVLALYLWMSKKLPIRILTLSALSILVMFVGYSSYALLLIRSNANLPMNQNSPDNVFSLGSYLNREQYGEAPLLYGQNFNSEVVRFAEDGVPYITEGKTLYNKTVKESPDEPDKYHKTGVKETYHWEPNTLFPRMYSNSTSQGHPQGYMDWGQFTQADMETVTIYPYVDKNGDKVEYAPKLVLAPTFSQNFRYFFNYQMIHMYWRYFMWNFAGRQNDLQGNGEPNRGNWISGIPFIDNPRLGDQSLLPYDMGEGNKGHNVFYMLPLLLGLLGAIWQACYSKRGIEQFWVVFFLFFMTGVAIVLYLNQPPLQPRERDYAFAGSFYAFAIWVGMGVAALWSILRKASQPKDAPDKNSASLIAAVGACLFAVLIPLQVVSQTWDDHDRSGRYTTRDFGMNYLSSVDENGIIFTNGDNDTFPLWYAQEVEGYRTDVRVVNLSYLTTDWYADQLNYPYYDSEAVEMTAKSKDYAYDRLQVTLLPPDEQTPKEPVDALNALSFLYSQINEGDEYPIMPTRKVYIPVDVEKSVEAGVINADEVSAADDVIVTTIPGNYMYLSGTLSLDMIATSAKNGWNRPVYFAMTVPENYYLGLQDYMRNTGLAYQVTPIKSETNGYDLPVNSDKMYKIITEDFKWGGLDQLGEDGKIYLDETIRRMVNTHRSSMIDLATTLYSEGLYAKQQGKYLERIQSDKRLLDSLTTEEKAQLQALSDSFSQEKSDSIGNDRLQKALNILDLMMEKLPVKHSPFSILQGNEIGNLFISVGKAMNDEETINRGLNILFSEIMNYSSYLPYYADLRQRGLYQNLSKTDRYVTSYLQELLSSYYNGGGSLEILDAELTQKGIDINDLIVDTEK